MFPAENFPLYFPSVLSSIKSKLDNPSVAIRSNLNDPSKSSGTLLFPWNCWFSICSECVLTKDWDSNCELIN